MSKSVLVNRRLYRALLRAVKPFTPPSPNASVLQCLLHRSFESLQDDEFRARRHREEDYYDELYPEVDGSEGDASSPQRHDAHFLLFRRLVWTVFSDNFTYTGSSPGSKMVPYYLFPNHVHGQPYKLRDIIRQEFRVPDMEVEDYIMQPRSRTNYLSAVFSIKARREAAFLALRRLNEKLVWADQLEASQKSPLSPKQSAKHVEPMWKAMDATKSIKKKSLSSHLKPGTYLVAHPHLTGFFHQTVVCILQHDVEDDKTKDDKDAKAKGTYGIVVNRPSISEVTGKNRTFSDSLNFQLPEHIAGPLGGAPIKDGGPVNLPSIQILHTAGCNNNKSSQDDDESKNDIGGTKLPCVTGKADEKAVFYRGDLAKAAEAVTKGQMDRDDVALFVGASCWYPEQLEAEIRQGCWLLCSGPPEIALSGACEHEPTEKGEQRPKADLWLSMMSAFGEDEAKLAHLMQSADENDEFGAPCDVH